MAALRRLREGECQFKARLGYLAKHCRREEREGSEKNTMCHPLLFQQKPFSVLVSVFHVTDYKSQLEALGTWGKFIDGEPLSTW
jgi:hypothetical protein